MLRNFFRNTDGSQSEISIFMTCLYFVCVLLVSTTPCHTMMHVLEALDVHSTLNTFFCFCVIHMHVIYKFITQHTLTFVSVCVQNEQCPDGDKWDNCTSVVTGTGACYDPANADVCCRTCYEEWKGHLPHSCRYGDRVGS